MGKQHQVHIGFCDIDECKTIVEMCKVFKENGQQIEFTQFAKLKFPDSISWYNSEETAELREWCRINGISLQVLQPTQLRFISDRATLDVYPKGRKYHDVTNNVRGNYLYLVELLSDYFARQFKS